MASAANLVAQLRLDLEDPELPGDGDDSDSLWSNAELIHCISEAQKRFARDVDCLPDSSEFTSKVSAGKPWIERDPLIIRIRSGYLRTAKREVMPITKTELDRGYTTDDYGIGRTSDWRTVTGTPRFVATDLDAAKNRLIPEPTANDTIEWSVYRLPLETVDSLAASLEIDEFFHYELLVWAKRLAFAKQDAETQDATRANAAERDWFNRVIPEARQYFRMKFRKAGTTDYGGIW